MEVSHVVMQLLHPLIRDGVRSTQKIMEVIAMVKFVHLCAGVRAVA